MKQEVKELLVQYQQGELDGVLVYQALAKLSPNESMKKALLELALAITTINPINPPI